MRDLHEWDLSYAEARRLQTELAGRVRIIPLQKESQFVAGLDCAFSRDGKRTFCAAVLLVVVGTRRDPGREADSFELRLVETASAEHETRYIPGLLSFREGPVCLAAAGRLSREPDLYVIDGQ
jgi:deoxyribonuclease V